MKIVYEIDGDSICAHASRDDGFTNMVEWPVGFGYSEQEAKKDLLRNVAAEGLNPNDYED